jgi:hypothetical protein
VANYQLVNPSPLQRLADSFGEHSSGIFSITNLKTQFQSNGALVEWPNQVFYRGQIQTDSSVADICLSDFLANKGHLNEVVSETDKAAFMNQLFQKPLVLIDTDMVFSSELVKIPPAVPRFADNLLHSIP